MKTRTIRPKRMNYIGPAEGPKATPIYPKISLGHSDLPEAKNWKIGQTYKVEMEIKMVGTRQTDRKEDDYGNESTFEIKKIGIKK